MIAPKLNIISVTEGMQMDHPPATDVLSFAPTYQAGEAKTLLHAYLRYSQRPEGAQDGILIDCYGPWTLLLLI